MTIMTEVEFMNRCINGLIILLDMLLAFLGDVEGFDWMTDLPLTLKSRSIKGCQFCFPNCDFLFRVDYSLAFGIFFWKHFLNSSHGRKRSISCTVLLLPTDIHFSHFFCMTRSLWVSKTQRNSQSKSSGTKKVGHEHYNL